MPFLYTEKKSFGRVANSLKKILAELHPSIAATDFRYVDALAITLGFDDFPKYTAAASRSKHEQNSSSVYEIQRDEELTSEALCIRRKEQARLLEKYLLTFHIPLSSKDLVEKWQPTAGRLDLVNFLDSFDF